MAKTKTPKEKKEALVDLSPKPEKIHQSQLAKLQGTIKTMDQVTVNLGQMEIQKYGLLKAMANVQQQIESIRKEFKEQYGTDNINIEDGTIAYEPEDSNTEENVETDKKD